MSKIVLSLAVIAALVATFSAARPRVALVSKGASITAKG